MVVAQQRGWMKASDYPFLMYKWPECNYRSTLKAFTVRPFTSYYFYRTAPADE